MPNRFSNTTFFAALVDGKRRPVATNIVDPGEVANPDPGGDGGGSQNPGGGDQGTGGDIGNPSGGGTVSTSPLTITRKSHQQDIFVAAGSTVSFTYAIDGPGSMFPKLGYEDMVESYSADGREMTLTWTCPADEPGDSWYVGCEAWAYVDDNTEGCTTLWDRIHVGNKVSSDLVRAGKGTPYPVINQAANSLMQAGKTLITNNGTYSDFNDVFTVGFSQYTDQEINSGVQNGVGSVLSGAITDKQGRVFDDYGVEKFTNIMAETPCGVVMDRGGYAVGVSMYGDVQMPNNGSTLNGFRSVAGIKVSGFAIRNPAINSGLMKKTIRCAITATSIVGNNKIGGNARLSANNWDGDGATFEFSGTLKCSTDHTHHLANDRFGFLYGGDATGSVSGTNIFTPGCVQTLTQDITQGMTTYGANETEIQNAFAMDDIDFVSGGRFNFSGQTLPNYSFIATNGQNNNTNLTNCLTLRNARSAYWANSSGQGTGDNDILDGCVFWGKALTSTNRWQDSLVRGGPITIKNCTIGNNIDQGQFSASMIDSGEFDADGLAIVSPTFDAPVSNDGILGNTFSSIGKMSISSDYDPDPFTASLAIEYTKTSRAGALDFGFKYITRPEKGSSADQAGVGSKNLFNKIGRYGKFYGDAGYNTVYTSFNALSRTCWREFREERKLYEIEVDGSNYTGNSGWSRNTMHPVDHILKEGTTPENPRNTPYIDDIYGHLDGSTAVLSWRPPSPDLRSTMTGYDILVDGIKVASNQDKSFTSFRLDGVSSGTRLFNVVVKDSLYGDSGLSRTVTLTIP